MANYGTFAEGDTYYSTRLNVSAWTGAADADKTKALTMATEIINRLNYTGEMTDSTQDNQFPRDDDTSTPDDIQHACFEIAMALLDGVDPDEELNTSRMIRFTYDAVTLTYSGASTPEHILAGVPSVTAWRLLFPYLRDVGNITVDRTS